ncbi:MAG: hypothetical protein Q8K71_08885 [Polaromonas sp.]|nr:hypothetical protein [Polaromonas sp.]
MRLTFVFTLTALSTATLLVACGGGSDSDAPAVVAPVSTTITGTAVKGPVEGATVTIKKASDGTTVATTTTTAGGAYTVSVPFQGDVVVEVSGGTYTDEATGTKTNLTSPMKSVLSVSGAQVTGVVTPLTTMAFTTSFPTGTAVTAAAFKTAASNLASQFQLAGVDLTTTTPVVTGTTNAYGNALRAVSQYLKDNNTTLGTITNQTLTQAQWANFSGKYSSAYQTANGQTVTYNISGNTISTSVTGAGPDGGTVTTTTTGTDTTVAGTGAGGGSGTCGVNASGVVSQSVGGQAFSVPVNINLCVTGIAAGSCEAGNAQLSQSLAGQQGLAGAVNLKYTYSASCAAGAINVALL